MQPLVFSAAWFARHQRSLRHALNMPGLGHELRAALGVQGDGQFRELRPHASCVERDGVFLADFRTHAKHAKRLRAVGRPLWSLFHWFDQRVANRWLPAINLGFDSFQAYPDSGVGATTVDGRVSRAGVDQAFTDIRSGAGNSTDPSAGNLEARLSASTTLNQYGSLVRSIATFDTSPLGSSATILTGVVSLFSLNIASTLLGLTTCELTGATPAANNDLQNSDYGQCQTTAFATGISSGSWVTSAYNDWTMNATGRAAINPAGITRLSWQLEWDRANNFTGAWVISSSTGFAAEAADALGNANDPKLVVTFTRKLVAHPGM